MLDNLQRLKPSISIFIPFAFAATTLLIEFEIKLDCEVGLLKNVFIAVCDELKSCKVTQRLTFTPLLRAAITVGLVGKLFTQLFVALVGNPVLGSTSYAKYDKSVKDCKYELGNDAPTYQPNDLLFKDKHSVNLSSLVDSVVRYNYILHTKHILNYPIVKKHN